MNITCVIMISAGAVTLLYALRKLTIRTIILSACAGVASLFAADVLLGFTHMNLPINCFSVLCAAVGGLPGTILLLLLNVVLMPV